MPAEGQREGDDHLARTVDKLSFGLAAEDRF
jgi:hypothetical protein